jgi:hypothetical protein
MIIKEPADWKYYLKKIASKGSHSFVVSNRVMLIINGKHVSNNFLAYQNGQWYGAKGHARGASQPIAEKGKHLFVISENSFWMMRNDRTLEYSSKLKPLSEDAVAFLFAEHEPGVCLYAVDGSKQPASMATSIDSAPYSADFAAMIVIALVKQHDPESAAQMEAFWFGDAENEADSGEDNTPPWFD